MTNKDKLLLMKDRYNKLISNGKNFEGTGVLRKLRRQIRNIEKNID